jgi:FixJ family two-component response regulator
MSHALRAALARHDLRRSDAPGPLSASVVYVVDDDESVRRALARLIRGAGHGVETFPSAAAFLESPAASHPACLVLDVRLPGASGLDLQVALAETGRSMPIIFITGYASVPMSVRAMKSGAVDFLQKPFDDQELLDGIQRALARDRATRAARAERDVVQHRLDTLTPRERQVLALVVRGLLNKQIAGELGAAEKTIKIHRGRVMRKMGADSVAALVRMVQKVEVA